MAKKSEKKAQTAGAPAPMEMKPEFSTDTKTTPALKGATVGDIVDLHIRGRVIGVNEDSWSDDRKTRVRLEIQKTKKVDKKK